MHILVVEDEDAIADPLVAGLRREGYDVSRVATGEGALEASPADLVLLDLRLPDIDGFDDQDVHISSVVPRRGLGIRN